MGSAEAFPDHEDQKALCLALQGLTSFGPNSGLRVYLHTNVDPSTVVDDKLSGQSTKITISSSCLATSMNVEGRTLAMPAGKYSLILKEVRTEFSSDLVSLPSEERGCYFEDEWPGSTPQNRKNFPERYSGLECIVMCKRQFVLETCKCLPYPLTLSDPNTVCLLSKTPECITNTSEWISFIRPAPAVPGFRQEEYSHGVMCPLCLPKCASSRFVVDPRMPTTGETTRPKAGEMAQLAQRTMLDVYFPGPNAAVLYTVMRTFSVANLLVTFGGLANLFLGMSYITLLELVILVAKCMWILFVRQWCVRRAGRQPAIPSP
ncbi:pickpocket protein 19-like isoform X2 [Frankliniella occidentalis]|uniref:Pickpocket protein 19-like isoform X2 n=1 Tax=Frankliniella occidentalis TaxID=133901 RepID=A0A6J1S3D8_FRAOC|nr:pickpocket protein 19-like isoform X2 [Frankliniella occidentalis]